MQEIHNVKPVGTVEDEGLSILVEVDEFDKINFFGKNEQVYALVKKLCELYPELLWLANGCTITKNCDEKV